MVDAACQRIKDRFDDRTTYELFEVSEPSPIAPVDGDVYKRQGVPYEIHGAWLQTTNPIACMGADPQRLYNALNKLDFIVVVDLFKTPTIAALADVVLPACTFPERNGIAFVSGAQRGSTINKVTDVGECRSDMQINLELGKRWNPEAWPWDNVDEMFTDMLKPTEMSFEELQSVAPAYQPIEYLSLIHI